ncbi:MAG: DUF3185 domain-containing protein [Deltaproteobacteria bacterium RIFOXYC2_FULL_48_10]|jgi:hypothetical protein|nr:DUF3185 domain-containing protein [Desulfobacteraceae bacterium]OGQ90085.1 MAG: DUF3185 domain-containing protein [Deltaproteobacteria bacterium RIFOXYC2_FULL_48_10]
MKANILLAVILIVIGVAALGYQGFSYTTREKIVDIGPLTMTADKTRTIPLPPIVGALALVGGIALLIMGRKNTL